MKPLYTNTASKHKTSGIIKLAAIIKKHCCNNIKVCVEITMLTTTTNDIVQIKRQQVRQTVIEE